MSSISPPPAAPPPSSSGAVVPQNTAVITDAPDAVRALPPGTRIDVQTLGDLVRGQGQANSAYGPLTLKGSLPALPADTALTLLVTGTPGTGVSFRLIAVNGQQITATSAAGTVGAGIPSSAAGSPDGLFSGQTAPGTLLQSANRGDAIALSLGKVFTATLVAGPLSPTGRSLAAQEGGTPASGGAASPTTAAPTAPPQSGVPAAGQNPAHPSSSGSASGGSPGTGASSGTQSSPPLQTQPAQTQSPSAPAGQAPPPSPGGTPAGGGSPGAGTGTGTGAGSGAGTAPPLPAAFSTGTVQGGAIPDPSLSGMGPLGIGSRMQVRLTAIQTPGASSPLVADRATSASGTALMNLSGSVAPSPFASASGSALVQTPQGLLMLDGRGPLPISSRVALDILSLSPPPGQAIPTSTAGTAAMGLPPPFAALDDALALLAREEGDAARALSGALPAADARLLSNVIAFSAAAKSADLKTWLGEKPIKALEKTSEKGRLALKGLEDIARDSLRPARDGGGEWRMLHLPFSFGGTIDRISVVTRKLGGGSVDDEGDGDGGRGGKKGGGVRFLFAVDLSRMGPMQFDGLYKTGKRQLSLVVRSTQPLPTNTRRDLLGLFVTSTEALGMIGTLAFQVTTAFPGPEEALPTSLRPTDGDSGSIVV